VGELRFKRVGQICGHPLYKVTLPRTWTCALRSFFFTSLTLAFCDSALVLPQPHPNFPTIATNSYGLEMDDLNNHLAQLLIRTPPLQARPPLQACESQGLRDFHQFSELPLEIRQIIWTFSLPGARSIRVRPIVPKDGLLLLLLRGQQSCSGTTDF